jgi:glycosyltransferase involved in cell wall biosynthesis
MRTVGPTLLINASMLNDPEVIGLGVYSHCLLRELLPMLAHDSVFARVALAGDRRRLEEVFSSDLRSGTVEICDLRGRSPLTRIIALHRVVRRERCRGNLVFYSPTHHGVVFRNLTQVVTVHDLFPLLFPDNYRRQHYYFRYYLPLVLRRSRAVITVSEHSALDLAEYFPVCPPITVAYEGLRQDLSEIQPAAIPELQGRRFFLFVGPSFRHKNAERLIEAFADLADDPAFADYDLAFAGGREPYLAQIKGLVANRYSSHRERIRFLGYVSRAQLAWLYKNAIANLITTLYEGFGLPALEAMHFGCPVVASRVASLPEVCGDAALYVGATRVDEIGSAMRRMATDQNLRTELIGRGRANLARFGWKKAAIKILELLTPLSGSARKSAAD